jgi:hypothetical protein
LSFGDDHGVRVLEIENDVVGGGLLLEERNRRHARLMAVAGRVVEDEHVDRAGRARVAARVRTCAAGPRRAARVAATPPFPPSPEVAGPPPAPCVVLAPPSPVVVETGPLVVLDESVTPLVEAPVTASLLPPVWDAKSLMTAIVSVSPLQAVARTNESANRNVV